MVMLEPDWRLRAGMAAGNDRRPCLAMGEAWPAPPLGTPWAGRRMPGKARPTALNSADRGEGAKTGGMGTKAPEALPAGGEAELVGRARSDPEAFAALYERHVRSVYAFALSRVREGAAAEDVTSQTFLKALHALPRYEQRGIPFKSWLFRIAANVIADRLRSPRTQGQVPLYRAAAGEVGEDLQIRDPRAEDEISAWEEAEVFARLIADLSPEQRAAVQLRFVDGLSIAEIAAHMARSQGAVKMLMMRALRHLRRSLDRESPHAG
jgi:RNA polymerase sigma-70 factor (ECF subfamily)